MCEENMGKEREGMRIEKVWFHLFLWHINHCWLFNAKSYFYIYIEYMIYKYNL